MVLDRMTEGRKHSGPPFFSAMHPWCLFGERTEKTDLAALDDADSVQVRADLVEAPAIDIHETPKHQLRACIPERVAPDRTVFHVEDDGVRVGDRRIFDPVRVEANGSCGGGRSCSPDRHERSNAEYPSHDRLPL